MASTLISKELWKFIQKYGEDKILEVLRGWQKKNEWQKDRYHKRLKPRYQAEREKLKELIKEQKEKESEPMKGESNE
jgi:hypothetical protein